MLHQYTDSRKQTAVEQQQRQQQQQRRRSRHGSISSDSSVIHSAGIALAKQGLTNWTTKPAVKAAIKEIRTLIGSEPDPCALTLREETYDGMRCLRPDYWVMRLSLLGLTAEDVERVINWMESTAPPSVRPQVKSIVNRIQELQRSKNASEETLCVNVTGGALKGREMNEARLWIADGPYKKQFSEVEGALIRH